MILQKQQRRLVCAVLWLFLLADLCFSFAQHFNSTLDGDMPAIVIPTPWYSEVLQDPFGIAVLTQGKSYPATNRFFAHWFESTYYKSTPNFFQRFVSPIDSVYLAGAVFKISVQLTLLLLLAAAAAGTYDVRRLEFVAAAALIEPLFQVNGFVQTITLLMHPTYTFFYTLPLTLLLFFMWPFYNALVLNRGWQLSWWLKDVLTALCVVIPFAGPLLPALVLLICPAVLLFLFSSSYRRSGSVPFWSRIKFSVKSIPSPLLFYFSLISLISCYSYYIGTFNAENATEMPLPQRYALLLYGLREQLFSNAAFPVLFVVIALNLWWLRRRSDKQLKLLSALLIFSVVYMVLLPLGGYRPYRPLIVRGDTFMPVTLCVIYAFALTSLKVLRSSSVRVRIFHALVLIAVAALFTSVDRLETDAHRCEKEALQTIAASREPVVRMETWCNLLEWHKINDPEGSRDCGELLYIWHITNEPKLYTTSK